MLVYKFYPGSPTDVWLTQYKQWKHGWRATLAPPSESKFPVNIFKRR